MAKKKILYIDGVGPFGGASRSLFEAVSRVAGSGEFSPHFLAARGTASKFYGKIAEDVIETVGLSRFDNTKYSHYRGLRWLILIREILFLPFMLASLLKAKRRWKAFDLIHINEVTELIPGLIAKSLFRCPLVVHVRSVQSTKDNLRTRVINRLLSRVEGVVCIDETVARSLADSVQRQVIHNSFTVDGDVRDQAFVEKISHYQDGFRVGFVGNLQEIKGVIELVEACALLKSRPDVRFLVVGDMTERKTVFRRIVEKVLGLSQDTKERVLEVIEREGLQDRFLMLGRTADISSAYSNFEVLCFPSHLDAPGRPVFESAFFAVPSIVCVREPTPDTLVPDVTGVCIPERDPRALADAIVRLMDSPSEREEMGRKARALALSNFEPQRNAEKLMHFYNSILSKH